MALYIWFKTYKSLHHKQDSKSKPCSAIYSELLISCSFEMGVYINTIAKSPKQQLQQKGKYLFDMTWIFMQFSKRQFGF